MTLNEWISIGIATLNTILVIYHFRSTTTYIKLQRFNDLYPYYTEVYRLAKAAKDDPSLESELDEYIDVYMPASFQMSIKKSATSYNDKKISKFDIIMLIAKYEQSRFL